MRKVRIKVLAILLLFCILLSGCNEWKNYIHTDASLTRAAEKALEKKYDEEFIIHKVWVACQTTFYAVCSPKSDEEVVFEAEIWKDGRGVYQDEYAEGVVAKQIREKLLSELPELFGECFVYVSVWGKAKTEFSREAEITIDDYLKQVEGVQHCLIHILVGKDRLQVKNIKKEYNYFEKNMIKGLVPEVGCGIYFVTEDVMKQSREYFQINAQGRTPYYDLIEECPHIGLGYSNWTINKTYEEYEKMRTEVLENE